MLIRATSDIFDTDWIALRQEFIPELDRNQQVTFLEAFTQSTLLVGFMATDVHNNPLGFAEASIRTDYVNGCQPGPVVYLEGIYVLPGKRKKGIARKLCSAIENWGREHQCKEFASDVLIEDTDSINAHCALGFEETERVIFYRKAIGSHN